MIDKLDDCYSTVTPVFGAFAWSPLGPARRAIEHFRNRRSPGSVFSTIEPRCEESEVYIWQSDGLDVIVRTWHDQASVEEYISNEDLFSLAEVVGEMVRRPE